MTSEPLHATCLLTMRISLLKTFSCTEMLCEEAAECEVLCVRRSGVLGVEMKTLPVKCDLRRDLCTTACSVFKTCGHGALRITHFCSGSN